VFASVTLEGWTYIMAAIAKSYTYYSPLFFIPMIFIGAFFLLNLTLAVIKAKFSEEHEKKSIKDDDTNRRKLKLIEIEFDDLDKD
jgi:hypothetical protein